MPPHEEIRVDRATIEAEVGALADYFIGFAKLSSAPDEPDAQLAGSGTLVVADGVHAILTADHVLEHLPRSGQIGLIQTTRFQPQAHRFTLSMDHAKPVRIGRGAVESEGPDLGLFILPPVEASRIPAGKTFYNLRLHADAVFKSPPAKDVGLWILCGMADEWTTESTPERGYDRVKVFRGMYTEGQALRETQKDAFDYFDFAPNYIPGQGPESFGGYSGGGLWQVVFRRGALGQLRADRHLAGVAFYQSPQIGKGRVVKCHGRRSIYEVALRELERIAQQGPLS